MITLLSIIAVIVFLPYIAVAIGVILMAALYSSVYVIVIGVPILAVVYFLT